MDILAALIGKVPFTVIGLLTVIIYGHLKMAACKREIYRDGRKYIGEEVVLLRADFKTKLTHLRELSEQKIEDQKKMIDQKMHDQKKLLDLEISHNKEAIQSINKS